MPFTLIHGRFLPRAGMPDGDSVRFRADDLSLWARLSGRPVRLGTGVSTRDSVQLRLEGIDAIERGATRSLALAAMDNLLRLLGFQLEDGTEPSGYILARMTDDESGRPICFAFAGDSGLGDGDDVFLDEPLLRRSVNYGQAQDGYAYPLYYNTLFASLREELTRAIGRARQSGLGYWPSDATTSGVALTGRADLGVVPPIWPKLWRRLDEYLAGTSSLDGFIGFLTERDERVDVLTVMEERGLQDLVEVRGERVRLTETPENLRVVGQAGMRRR
jgi:endonuclease YncB( thermonuclease family)